MMQRKLTAALLAIIVIGCYSFVPQRAFRNVPQVGTLRRSSLPPPSSRSAAHFSRRKTTMQLYGQSAQIGYLWWTTFASFLGPDFQAFSQDVADFFVENPAASQSIIIGCSLLFCLTIVNSLDGVDEKDTFENRQAFVAWLTRPITEYSGDEAFNVFLVFFHGFCFYDAFKRGDFNGFSFFSLLPLLATVVALQIVAKVRSDQRGWDLYKSKFKGDPDVLKDPAGWKAFKKTLDKNGREIVGNR